MKPIYIRILGSLLLTGAITSLYLPFFESFTESIIHRPLSIISERPNPHQGGLFGGGFYTTYNGFGSIIALFNCVIATLLYMLIFRKTPIKMPFNILLTLFIASHLLIIAGMIMAPFVLSPPDKMLSGYFLQLLCELFLFVLVYRARKRYLSTRASNPDILDESID